MSAEEELKDAIGDLESQAGPRPIIEAVSLGGPATTDEMLVALRRDIRKLYGGLLFLARQVDDLRD